MKDFKSIKGKYVIEGDFSFFMFRCKFRARFVRDTESDEPRFLVDEENVSVKILGTPKDEGLVSIARMEELQRVAISVARGKLTELVEAENDARRRAGTQKEDSPVDRGIPAGQPKKGNRKKQVLEKGAPALDS